MALFLVKPVLSLSTAEFTRKQFGTGKKVRVHCRYKREKDPKAWYWNKPHKNGGGAGRPHGPDMIKECFLLVLP